MKYFSIFIFVFSLGVDVFSQSIVGVARNYLAASPGKYRDSLAAILKSYSGAIDLVIDSLKPSSFTETRKGKIGYQHFILPEYASKYPLDLLHFYVPDHYTGDSAYGLITFMHGSGAGVSRSYGYRTIILSPAEGGTYGLRPYTDSLPFILVAPSAPDTSSDVGWNAPGSDDYIAAVIRESETRFNIDPNRIFLGGCSMGGFGAYELCQRMSDRIAGGIASAGSWWVTNWRSMVGSAFYIFHGVNDAYCNSEWDYRWRYTDVYFARAADTLLDLAGAEHIYYENDGGHNCFWGEPAEGTWRQFMPVLKAKKRDPYATRMVALTRKGNNAACASGNPDCNWTFAPTPHGRWLQILKTGAGTLTYDALRLSIPNPSGDVCADFNKQYFWRNTTTLNAGMVEGDQKGSNAINLVTENVDSFSLWLHPSMVDFSKPINLTLNGKALAINASPTLLDALRSYERRKDWGLIYHSEVKIWVNPYYQPGVDTIKPSTPANLTAVALPLSKVRLTWNASTDNMAVKGYLVYRMGKEIGTAFTCTYTDSGLVPQTTYLYTVAAFDYSGNISSPSAGVSVKTSHIVDYDQLNLDMKVDLDLIPAGPFQGVRVRYQVATPCRVQAGIYDLAGNHVISLLDENQKPGHYSLNWDGTNEWKNLLPSGLYILRLQQNGRSLQKKIMRIR